MKNQIHPKNQREIGKTRDSWMMRIGRRLKRLETENEELRELADRLEYELRVKQDYISIIQAQSSSAGVTKKNNKFLKLFTVTIYVTVLCLIINQFLR
jgi:hypothetical protein